MNNQFSFTLSSGAQVLALDKTRFRLWAPTATEVHVEIADGQTIRMEAEGDSGWYSVEASCGPGARYLYRVHLQDGSELAVPDPVSRHQHGDVHDASVVIDPQAYIWQNAGWMGRPWHETILYELHVGACGGFNGVINMLPDLARLGITAIELMPIAEFPGAHNWGYDGVLPYAPDASYGTPEQLKQLIDRAHGMGIMVFLDVVYNHFGPDGNYLATYAAPFFREDSHTPWGQAIDFRRPEVSDFFIENALYWLMEYRFDGLRFDAVHAITEQDWLPELAKRIRAGVEPGRHVHLVLENEHNGAHLLSQDLFNAQWNDDGHHAMHVLLTGEHDAYYRDFAEQPARKLARCLAEGFVYQGDPSPYKEGALRGEVSSHLPPTAFILFLQNHDQIGNRAFGDRLTQLAHPQALRVASALLLLTPQIPMLFMGEEFGARQPFLYFTDHQSEELANAVRNGRRQEFARFPAFSDPARRAQIPDPNARHTFDDSVPVPDTSVPDDDSAAWQSWISSLLALRHAHILPHMADVRALKAADIGPAAVAARWRMKDGSVLFLAANLAEQATPIALDTVTALPGANVLLETPGTLTAMDAGEMPGHAFIAILEPAA
jgi:maltooligosyltrehalose trehalohydrolase